MKLEKNKIVFAGVLICVVLFIGAYSVMVLGDDEESALDGNQIPVPELKDEQQEYESKLEALDDLKEVRQTNAPSIYDERLLDSSGVFDPDLLDKEKMRIVDSIYKQGQIRYSQRTYQNINPRYIPKEQAKEETMVKDSIDEIAEKDRDVAAKELGLEHQLFFASHPVENEVLDAQNTDAFIYVRVDGTQILRTDYRLKMRLLRNATIYGRQYPKNTAVYGFVSFKPNRVVINIAHIKHQPVKLKAYDLQDGSEGVYIQNSFRAEATNEVVGDLVDDINITGVPQVSGIRKIFQRNHKRVKVTIANNYQLLLKTSKPSLTQIFGKPKSH